MEGNGKAEGAIEIHGKPITIPNLVSALKLPPNKGKVIIIDMVLGAEEDNERDITEMKLIFDVLMMVLVTGRERTEKEYERLFIESGFTSHKITPIFGLTSLIEVFP
nr:trans-resveratrol di-O-methyltransferase-like [Ipomoea batatas]